jgi:hypothetical protein
MKFKDISSNCEVDADDVFRLYAFFNFNKGQTQAGWQAKFAVVRKCITCKCIFAPDDSDVETQCGGCMNDPRP